MASPANTCVGRSSIIMKSAIFRAVQPVWGKRIMCYDYVHDYVTSPQISPSRAESRRVS